ncbi:hypothetical protein BDR22DRAFT_892644 [Usnea florida]
MSFGFGIGDFVAVGNLAWTVYRSCKGLTEEFQEVCLEALTVHTLIKELQDEAIDPQSLLNVRGAPRKQELMTLINNLEESLKELDEIVRKYQGLTRRDRSIWNQLRLASEDLEASRSKLTFHVTAINAFISSLSGRTLVQIEAVLLELVSEVRKGRREPSLASLHETNNDSVWRELENELATDGISSTEITKHKAAIKIFIQGLLSETNADTTSLVEIVSLKELDNDDTDSESLSHGSSATDISHEDPAESPIASNVQNGSLVSLDKQQYEVTDEGISVQETGASIPMTVLLRDPVYKEIYNYVCKVKIKFHHGPYMYRAFGKIMKSFNAGFLDEKGVIFWVSALFASSPELLQEFTRFAGDVKIECGTVDTRYAFRVISDSTPYVRIPDLQAMESLISRRPPPWKDGHLHIGQLKWIDPASLNILRPSPKIAAPLSWTEEPAARVSEVLEAREMLSPRLKAFLARLKAKKKLQSTQADLTR